MRRITEEQEAQFERYLREEERSGATLEKYLRDVRAFKMWLNGCEFDKMAVLKYKAALMEVYAVSSVNSMLSSLNSFFACLEWHELRVKTVKVQRQVFTFADQELTKAEYDRLLATAKETGKERLWLVMQVICSAGIRVSELCYITVDAVKCKRAEILCKGKRRSVFLPDQLCVMLMSYIKKHKIKEGPVFVTKNGKPLDRSNIWAGMKKLCKGANVSRNKVFPHNLRHLFARTYYTFQKDIVRLADILGHSSVNTTRIYTMESGEVHRRQIQKLGLLRC